ncbi:protein PRRC1 [Nilaparvata lugens]|uniref:protein PRRC1 n=1 Tax=Nilaparvata lugens TaxID=108931 RepID=UPI00193D43EF|nr:protein PRRC1 [Nilaparvata lugens]XP_022186516.2 protein PRRC1 [Nilaparvata lugens]
MQADSKSDAKVEEMSSSQTSSSSPSSSTASLQNKDAAAAAKSGLLSSVSPPSALPSFVPVPAAAAASNTAPAPLFHPTTFSPAIPADKASGEGVGVGKEGGGAGAVAGEGGFGLMGWVRGAVDTSSSIVSKVAEKAKSSVDTMITTLDPQMKELLSPSVLFEVVVTSEEEIEISPIREAFHQIFGSQKVTVRGVRGTQEEECVAGAVSAVQPVGFEAAQQKAWKRIEALRAALQQPGPVVAVESFITELSPDKWYDVHAIVLSDSSNGIVVETFSQMTPIPSSIVTLAQDDTPADYQHKAAGFAVDIATIMASNLHVHESEWHHALTGVSRRDMILLAAKSLVNIYKNSLQ